MPFCIFKGGTIMYCKKCGGYNIDGTQKCITCGHFLGAVSEGISAYIPSSKPAEVLREDNLSPHVTAATETLSRKYTNERPPETPPAQPQAAEKPVAVAVTNVKTYLTSAVLVAIFFWMPFGIAALIMSAMTSAAAKAGDAVTAKVYSQKTRLFCWLGLLTGLVSVAIVTLLCMSLLPLRAIITIPDLNI